MGLEEDILGGPKRVFRREFKQNRTWTRNWCQAQVPVCSKQVWSCSGPNKLKFYCLELDTETGKLVDFTMSQVRIVLFYVLGRRKLNLEAEISRIKVLLDTNKANHSRLKTVTLTIISEFLEPGAKNIDH